MTLWWIGDIVLLVVILPVVVYLLRGVLEAARSIVCLHGTDPATVYLSAWARVERMTIADLDGAIYSERTLVRHLAMRRTLFVFPRETLGFA